MVLALIFTSWLLPFASGFVMDDPLIYRLLSQINENLHQTVGDLRTLCSGISVPGERLDRMVTMIEESRAVINRTLAEHIEQMERVRAGELGRIRREQEERA